MEPPVEPSDIEQIMDQAEPDLLSTKRQQTNQRRQQSHVKHISKPDQCQPESYHGASCPHHLLISPTNKNYISMMFK